MRLIFIAVLATLASCKDGGGNQWQETGSQTDAYSKCVKRGMDIVYSNVATLKKPLGVMKMRVEAACKKDPNDFKN